MFDWFDNQIFRLVIPGQGEKTPGKYIFSNLPLEMEIPVNSALPLKFLHNFIRPPENSNKYLQNPWKFCMPAKRFTVVVTDKVQYVFKKILEHLDLAII